MTGGVGKNILNFASRRKWDSLVESRSLKIKRNYNRNRYRKLSSMFK